MRRATYPLGSIAALAVLVAGVGCDLLPDPEFAAIERSLELSILEADRAQSGDAVDFEFELKNSGESTARACLGPSRIVSYKTSAGGGSSFDGVDHPGCLREFAIRSGDAMRWRETLRVSGASSGQVEVEVEIEVVNPRRCGGVGCPSIQVKSRNKRNVT